MKHKSADNDNPFIWLGEKLRATAGKPNIQAYVPHEKQIKFHTAEKKIRLYIGGNRSGKTTGGVCEDIWWATGRHPYIKTPAPPIRGRVVGVDFLNGIAKIVLPEFARWTPLSDLVNGSWEDSYDKELRTLHFANGSFIEFMSYDQELDKFAGTSRHFVHYDEEPPSNVYTECQMRLIDTGGNSWITMTPVEGMTWLYDDLYLKGKPDDDSIPDPNIGVIEVEMDDNPHLAKVEIDMIMSLMKEEDREARRKGKYVQFGGLIYPNFNDETHILRGFELPDEWPVYASMDHGLRNPTAWLWHTVDNFGRVVTFAEYYQADKSIDAHAAAYHVMNQKIGRVPDYNVGDPTIRNRSATNMVSVQQEYIKFGVFIVLGNNDKTAGINRVRRHLGTKMPTDKKPFWQITDQCPKLRWEMKRYKWKKFVSQKVADRQNPLDEPIDRDNHALDAARYFIMSRPDLTILGPKSPAPNQKYNVLGLPTSMPSGPVTMRQVENRHLPPNGNLNPNWDVEEYMGSEW